MKIRTGFVSNSSSSCFICNTNMTLMEVKGALVEMLEHDDEHDDDGEGYLLYFDEVFQEPHIGNQGDVANYAGWGYTDRIIGNVLINSACDNTIPYSLYELIEEKFNAYRIHLG